MVALIFLSVIGLVCMMLGLFKISSKIVWGIAVGGLLVASFFISLEWGLFLTYFNDMVYYDNYAIAFSIAIMLLTVLVLMLIPSAFDALDTYKQERYALFLFAVVGMLCMVAFDHMAMLFIGIEIMSISLYVLAGSNKKELASNEAALKYLLLGAFTTGIILMGITLIYGETSSFHLYKISKAIEEYNDLVNSPLLTLGIVLLLVGMAFKISLVPFHFWTPDVYQGAPTYVTVFMSTIVKVAGVATFFRLFMYTFTQVADIWIQILTVIAALTLIFGGISAVVQTSVKRMLAYSSISHAGYIMIVFLAADASLASTVLFYMVAYAISGMVALSITMLVERTSGSDTVEAFNGLSKTNPMLSFFLLLSMLSLAGIPLTAGFLAKFYVFSAGIQYGYTWLVLIAVLNAIIGMYYYLKLVIAIYFNEPSASHVKVPVSPLFLYTMMLCTVFTIQFGLFPESIYQLFSK